MCFPKNISFVFLMVALGACRSNYALFNESYTPSYHKLKAKSLNVPIEKLEIKRGLVKTYKIKPELKIKPVPTHFSEIEIKDRQVVIPLYQLKAVEKTILKQDPVEKAKRKKKKQRNRFWRKTGSNLFIGVVFLGVAVVLSLIHLQSLAVLFGLASILFLFFGLKKFFRRRKRAIRNPFQKNK